MIGEYTLLSLCEKYHISSENIINKNNNILTYGEYNEINDTLSFLINEFGVSPKNIEKCPSIRGLQCHGAAFCRQSAHRACHGLFLLRERLTLRFNPSRHQVPQCARYGQVACRTCRA